MIKIGYKIAKLCAAVRVRHGSSANPMVCMHTPCSNRLYARINWSINRSDAVDSFSEHTAASYSTSDHNEKEWGDIYFFYLRKNVKISFYSTSIVILCIHFKMVVGDESLLLSSPSNYYTCRYAEWKKNRCHQWKRVLYYYYYIVCLNRQGRINIAVEICVYIGIDDSYR